MKFKEIRKEKYTCFPLQLQGKIYKHPITQRSRFEFPTSCNSKLYPFSLHYVLVALARYYETITGCEPTKNKISEFIARIHEYEIAVVDKIAFRGLTCVLRYEKRLDRGKGRHISYKPLD